MPLRRGGGRVSDPWLSSIQDSQLQRSSDWRVESLAKAVVPAFEVEEGTLEVGVTGGR